MTGSRMRRPGALVVALLTAALAACSPTTDQQTDPEPTSPTNPTPTSLDATPTPEATTPTAAPAGPSDIADGLTTPPGTTLVAPAQHVTHRNVTGWWAALEVTVDDLAAVADNLGAQLIGLGLQVQITEVDGVHVITAEGTSDTHAHHYDVQVIPATGDLPAQVQILAAAEPLVLP